VFVANPAITPKMEKVSPEARGYVIGLLAQGRSFSSTLKEAKRLFKPANQFPCLANFCNWVELDPVQAEIEKAREHLREIATERSFADTRQQIDALVTNAERLYSLFLELNDKEIISLVRLNGEIRETFKAIREAASPFQTTMPEVLSSFEVFQKTASRPREIRERLEGPH
jgi:hypothetical protein